MDSDPSNNLLRSALLALVLGPTASVAAQDSTATVRTAVAGELVMEYGRLLQQYRQMRMILPDSVSGPAEDDGVRRLEIDGLVVDETQTKIGRDFYDLFFSMWQKPRDVFNYTVTVQEQPVPNAGTRVRVKVNDEIAYEGQLQPRYEVIEDAARQAVYYTYHFLLQSQSRGPITY